MSDNLPAEPTSREPSKNSLIRARQWLAHAHGEDECSRDGIEVEGFNADEVCLAAEFDAVAKAAKLEALKKAAQVTPEMVQQSVGKFGANLPRCRTVANRINGFLAAAIRKLKGEA